MVDEESDDRLRSLGAAVEFAKDNNLLGIFVDAELLVSAFLFVLVCFRMNHNLIDLK
jgi:hypothetical protein